MGIENLDLDKIEDIANRLDEFNHLLKCFATCHFNEFDADQIYAAISCFPRIISDIREDLDDIVKNAYQK